MLKQRSKGEDGGRVEKNGDRKDKIKGRRKGQARDKGKE
jgi:hypothetical protein